MDAEQIRQRILSDHSELRERITEVEALAERFEAGDGESGGPLRERGLALYARFSAHLELEDRQLGDALRALDKDEKRSDRLAREHREQRELLKYLMGRLAQQSEPTSMVARELTRFCSFLRHDMASEEENLLSDELLGASQVASEA